MFNGRYEHNIDEKGRLTIPARFRELLDSDAYVLQGFDCNLLVLTAASFARISERINQLNMADPVARQLKRMIFSSAEHCEFDRAGRMLLPQYLREAAKLNGTAMVVGAGEYIEIWSPALWEEQSRVIQEADAQRFAAFDLSFR